MTAVDLLEEMTDGRTFRPRRDELRSRDLLGFRDRKSYAERLDEARSRSDLDEAFIGGEARIAGQQVAVGAYEFAFIGGGMGCVVGERIGRLFERATVRRQPVVIVHRSGGARMQEGTWSLFQMAKVCAALSAHRRAGLFYVSVLLDPCMGGVLASTGALGHVVLAQAGAQIGFAGSRVVRETLGRELPQGLQTAEALQRNGFIDRTFGRGELPGLLRRLFTVERTSAAPRATAVRRPSAGPLPDRMATVRRSRALKRPRFQAWLDGLFDDFLELHGDRCGGDDPALRGGLTHIGGRDILLLGIDRGSTVQELSSHNFGMVHPAGYRKAARLFRLAGTLGIPIVTLIDTPGAAPTAEAERAGQSFAIAEALQTLVSVEVPVVGLVTGEGGNGGAIALAAADHLIMLEQTHLSVISPEGCAAILWRERRHAERAASELRSTARDLVACGLADELIPEGEVSDTRPSSELLEATRYALEAALERLAALEPAELARQRRRRFHRDVRLLQ
jgi:acetyl-CoA carboxylase carboxyl transferase subunit beta